MLKNYKNAQGDVFNARGDIFSARGDVFNYAVDPLPGMSDKELMDKWRKGYITDEQYQAKLDYNESNEKQSSPKIFNILDNVLGLAGKGVDIFNTYKSGATVEDSGVDYKIEAGSTPEKPSYTMYYIAGAAVVLLIVVGLYVSRNIYKK